MKILITGGARFIGSHLCEKYTKEGLKKFVDWYKNYRFEEWAKPR